MDFAYYFIAASTHVDTSGTSRSRAWCKDFTSNDDMAQYVESKSNFPMVFAAHVQGRSVDQAVAQVTEDKAAKNKPRNADVVKGQLVACLREAFSKFLYHLKSLLQSVK